MNKIFYFIIFILLFNDCSDNSTGNEEINHPPQIVSLIANPDTTETGATTAITCNASDSDGDNLTFVWDAAVGTINGSGSNVNWVAPNSVGTYYVRCKVQDGNGGEDADSVNIVVEQQLPTQGLVAYFPFNGNANDESGNGNNGTVHGAILTTDRFGKSNSAYNFEGNDYIKASADNLPTAERTVSLWFNANTLSSRPVLLGYGGNGPPGTSWWMNLNHGGTPAYFLGVHYTQSNYLKYFYIQEPIGEWINFTATTNSNGSKIFINGEEMASNSFFINNTFVTGKDLSFGVNVSGYGIAPAIDNNTGYFIGIIDDIRIYDRALTNDEIMILYHEGGW